MGKLPALHAYHPLSTGRIDEGLLLPLYKKKKPDRQRYHLIKWTDDLRAVIARAVEICAQGAGRT